MEEEADWLGSQDVRSDVPVSSWLFFFASLKSQGPCAGETHYPEMPMVAKEKTPPPKINPVLSSQQPGKRTAELSWPLQNGHTSATVHSSSVDASLSTFLFTYPSARLRGPGLPPSPRLSFLTHRS